MCPSINISGRRAHSSISQSTFSFICLLPLHFILSPLCLLCSFFFSSFFRHFHRALISSFYHFFPSIFLLSSSPCGLRSTGIATNIQVLVLYSLITSLHAHQLPSSFPYRHLPSLFLQFFASSCVPEESAGKLSRVNALILYVQVINTSVTHQSHHDNMLSSKLTLPSYQTVPINLTVINS